VYPEERIGQWGKDMKFHVCVVLLLAQRRRCERVPQQIHPLLVLPLRHRQLSEPKTRLALYREESVRCSDIAPSLKVPSCFLSLFGNNEVLRSVAHCFALVPEALHIAHQFDAPVLQPDDRERMVCAARCMQAGGVRPLEVVEDGLAGSVTPTRQQLLQALLPLDHP
jgi:hypothetical protein